MQLSKNFTFEELTRTSHTSLLNINQEEAKSFIKPLTDLCEKVLEPLREILGKAISINSGFRGKSLNKKVGGASSSQHCYAEAVDIRVKDISAEELFKIIRNNLDKFNDNVGQVILEKVGGAEWIHISYKSERYKEVLKSRYGSDKTVFLTTTDGKKYTKV